MSPSDPAIRYFRLPRTVDRNEIEEFATALRKRVARGREFACLVTTDGELQRLNREFLRKDYATDVLSFPAGGTDDYLGDLAISWQRARAQAGEFGHGIETEIRILMLHGVLHLTGLDHEADTGEMRRAEKRWRRVFDLPEGLIERVQA